MDIFNSISHGFITALAKEFFSRLVAFLIENNEKIIVVFKKKTRDYDLSNNHPNTAFTWNGKEIVAHS